jgi:hypothetical protein
VLIADDDKRTENLMRLSFIWGRSGTFSETPQDFARVTEDLRREFAISEDGIRDAMKRSELLNEARREAAKRLEFRGSMDPIIATATGDLKVQNSTRV